MEANKLARIGDVARELDVSESAVRYWSDQFPLDIRRVGNQRRYPQKTVNSLRLVKFLLKNEGYSVYAARKHFIRLVSCRW